MEKINEHFESGAEQSFLFNVEMTTAIKGAAIYIMFFHHFFGFPDWLNKGIIFYGVPFRNTTIEYYLAVFGKICVAMYTVLSGYGLFISFQIKGKELDVRYLVKKTMYLLINWWLIILIVEVPVMIFGSMDGGFWKIVDHMILYDLDGNPFVGYLKFYLLALWTSPFWYYVVSKCKWEKSFIIIIPFMSMILRKAALHIVGDMGIFYMYMLYIPYFLIGMMICKSQLYQKVYVRIRNWKALMFMTVTGCMVLIIVRLLTNDHALSFDGWFAGIFIFIIGVYFQNARKTRKAFTWLGKYSTSLWYSHAVWIFGGITMQQILYAPKVPIIIVCWGILLCMPGAIVVSWVMKFIKRKKNESITC